MNIRFPADRRGIAQHSRHPFDGRDQIVSRFALGAELAQGLQGLRRQNGAGPSPEMFRREWMAANFAEIRIDSVRGHINSFAVGVEIGKELLTGQITTTADDGGKSEIYPSNTEARLDGRNGSG